MVRKEWTAFICFATIESLSFVDIVLMLFGQMCCVLDHCTSLVLLWLRMYVLRNNLPHMFFVDMLQNRNSQMKCVPIMRGVYLD